MVSPRNYGGAGRRTSGCDNGKRLSSDVGLGACGGAIHRYAAISRLRSLVRYVPRKVGGMRRSA
jgi:hypothetical protein